MMENGVKTFKQDIFKFDTIVSSPTAYQNIVEAEYFINTDPGFGNGMPMLVNSCSSY